MAEVINILLKLFLIFQTVTPECNDSWIILKLMSIATSNLVSIATSNLVSIATNNLANIATSNLVSILTS